MGCGNTTLCSCLLPFQLTCRTSRRTRAGRACGNGGGKKAARGHAVSRFSRIGSLPVPFASCALAERAEEDLEEEEEEGEDQAPRRGEAKEETRKNDARVKGETERQGTQERAVGPLPSGLTHPTMPAGSAKSGALPTQIRTGSAELGAGSTQRPSVWSGFDHLWVSTESGSVSTTVALRRRHLCYDRTKPPMWRSAFAPPTSATAEANSPA